MDGKNILPKIYNILGILQYIFMNMVMITLMDIMKYFLDCF